MKPIIIHDKAKQELDQSIGYYEQQKRGLGLDFLSEVEKALEKINDDLKELGMGYAWLFLGDIDLKKAFNKVDF